ncbi:acyltransferase family protein [Sulfuricurvum sp.]|uniref:acyltransferase family protein n=1 Tax=Sulfuricurvum sp. TaxID=2025608 RepID=UPI0026353AE8|nr:acyltransferase family protein [Sulfuricurvum sp.]MDD3597082.1 acyltransferase family protein [Sulfuricurvum sp.]
MNRDDTLFLRFLAIILVINSHIDVFYPNPLFGSGGAIGDALFFMLSSYGLLLSEQSKPQNFSTYLSKRILRIYPVVWTTILFIILPLIVFYYLQSDSRYRLIIDNFGFNSSLQTFSLLFFPPSSFWFLEALMFFYVVGFFFLKNYSNRKLMRGMIVLALLYTIFYLQFNDYSTLVVEQTISFKVIFYGMVFLSGIYFGSIHERIRYSGIRDYIFLLLCISAIYAHKFMMMHAIAANLQFIQQLFLFPTIYFFLKVSKSPLILEGIMKPRFLNSTITLIGAMTLELYLIHGPFRAIAYEYFPAFPWNVIGFFLLVLVLSYGLYRLNGIFIDKIKRFTL